MSVRGLPYHNRVSTAFPDRRVVDEAAGVRPSLGKGELGRYHAYETESLGKPLPPSLFLSPVRVDTGTGTGTSNPQSRACISGRVHEAWPGSRVASGDPGLVLHGVQARICICIC